MKFMLGVAIGLFLSWGLGVIIQVHDMSPYRAFLWPLEFFVNLKSAAKEIWYNIPEQQ